MNRKNIERPRPKFDSVAYNREYSKTHYKQFTANLKIEEFQKLENYCHDNGISRSEFLRRIISELDL